MRHTTAQAKGEKGKGGRSLDFAALASKKSQRGKNQAAMVSGSIRGPWRVALALIIWRWARFSDRLAKGPCLDTFGRCCCKRIHGWLPLIGSG